MGGEPPADTDVLLRLPAAERGAFKDPIGPVYTDPEELLSAAGSPLLAVGDVVATTLLEAGRPPDVAVVDGRTEREPIDEGMAATLAGLERTVSARNPAGTITRSLVTAMATAIEATEPVRVVVEGEEDLAVLPAILLAPTGTTVVYGQPGRGMVAVTVTDRTRADADDLLERLDGDHAALRAMVGSG